MHGAKLLLGLHFRARQIHILNNCISVLDAHPSLEVFIPPKCLIQLRWGFGVEEIALTSLKGNDLYEGIYRTDLSQPPTSPERTIQRRQLNSKGKGSEAGGGIDEIIMASKQAPAFLSSSDKNLLVLDIQWVQSHLWVSLKHYIIDIRYLMLYLSIYMKKKQQITMNWTWLFYNFFTMYSFTKK